LIKKPKEHYNLLFNDKKVKLYEGDITNFHSLKSIILKEDFDYIFHLASTNINYGKNFSPIETFDTNVKGAYNLLESCRLYGNDHLKIIFTSSREVYNEKSIKSVPKNEYHPYAVSKMCMDLICKSYKQNYGLNVFSIRSPNVYGGGDFNWNRIVPGTIKCLLQDKRPIIRTDGNLLRSYIYVQDLVDVIILLGEKSYSKDIKSEIYDIDDLGEFSTLEIMDRIINISGLKNIKPIIKKISKDEKYTLIPGFENTIGNLGWRPKFSIDKGLKQTFEWYKNYFIDNSHSNII